MFYRFSRWYCDNGRHEHEGSQQRVESVYPDTLVACLRSMYGCFAIDAVFERVHWSSGVGPAEGAAKCR